MIVSDQEKAGLELNAKWRLYQRLISQFKSKFLFIILAGPSIRNTVIENLVFSIKIPVAPEWFASAAKFTVIKLLNQTNSNPAA